MVEPSGVKIHVLVLGLHSRSRGSIWALMAEITSGLYGNDTSRRLSHLHVACAIFEAIEPILPAIALPAVAAIRGALLRLSRGLSQVMTDVRCLALVQHLSQFLQLLGAVRPSVGSG